MLPSLDPFCVIRLCGFEGFVPSGEGMSDGVMHGPGKIVADEITVDGDDLETVDRIQAGLHPTAQQVATNEKGITSNQQQISANTQQIQANISDIQHGSLPQARRVRR